MQSDVIWLTDILTKQEDDAFCKQAKLFVQITWTLEEKARNRKMTYWMERVVLLSRWRKPLHIVAPITLMRNPNPYRCILANSNSLFHPNAEVSGCCPNDAAMCKSDEKSYRWSIQEISPPFVGKLKGPLSLTDTVEDESKSLARYLLIDVCLSTN